MISFTPVSSVLAKLAVLALVFVQGEVFAETPQEHVHRMSHHVMPFEMSTTVHVFEMTEAGGIQRVLTRDPSDVEQIALIRQHLKHEAERFRNGDYSDPAKLHGEDMPGLADLQASPSGVDMSYSELAAGAQLSFKTDDMQAKEVQLS